MGKDKCEEFMASSYLVVNVVVIISRLMRFCDSLRSKRFCAVREQRYLVPFSAQAKYRKSRSSVFLCSQTQRKRLLHRLILLLLLVVVLLLVLVRSTSEATDENMLDLVQLIH